MRTKPRVTLLLGLVFVLGSAVAQADAPDKTLRSLLLDNVRVTSPVVSPDAQTIAYLVRTPRNDTDDPGPGRWSAWVLTEGQELPKQYTRSDDGTISQLRFTPDSNRLTFVSRRSDNAQVYALPLDGGEA